MKDCPKVFNLTLFKKFLVKNLILDDNWDEDLELEDEKRMKLFDSMKNDNEIFNCKY